MLRFKIVIPLMIAIAIGQAGVEAQEAQPQVKIPSFEISVYWSFWEGIKTWNGDAKVWLYDDDISPEEMQALLLQVIQEAVNKLPFAVEDWVLSVKFFKGQEQIAGTLAKAFNTWLDPTKVAGILLAWALTGGCESQFSIKHNTYLATGAPVEVTYSVCRYGSGPKMKVLLGEGLPPSSNQSESKNESPQRPQQPHAPPSTGEVLLLGILIAVIFLIVIVYALLLGNS